MSKVVLPGATIGVLGSGQLGRMFAIAARRLGYRVHVLSPDDDTPTGQVADLEVKSNYNDLEAVAQFAQQVDVVTFEFENVPFETIEIVNRYVPVNPGGNVLHTTQQRIREKTFLRNAGIPVTPFLEIGSLAELKAADADYFPGILKTASWGYDGKGQTKIDSHEAISSEWSLPEGEHAILEKRVEFSTEFSIVAARGLDKSFVSYPPIINTHRNHILDLSLTPGNFSNKIIDEATDIARTILEKLEVIGVLCVEFFLTESGELLVNELAPRPHNSGHLTIDAHVSCQFEQQVRAVCGLPLAATTQLRPAAMVNLLGDIWESGSPLWTRALAFKDAKLHLYGKRDARPGRKMGHITVLADSTEQAVQQAIAARESLTANR